MFSGTVSGAGLAWLLGLLGLWAALLFGGFLFGRPDATGQRRMPAWTRLGSSAVLVVAAWIGFGISRDTPVASFALLVAAGMTLGFAGDLRMARVFALGEPVLAGMAAFGLGHLAYIFAGLSLGSRYTHGSIGARAAAWIAWCILAALLWYLIVFRGQAPTVTHWAALPYALLLSSTAGVGTGLALQESRLAPFAVGAALFLASDLILAAHTFAGRGFPLIQDAIWLTYGPGQMLIVYSICGALWATVP